jgi:hypothetical protein
MVDAEARLQLSTKAPIYELVGPLQGKIALCLSFLIFIFELTFVEHGLLHFNVTF